MPCPKQASANYPVICISGGIQFATAQLPLLELMDCGMTICDPSSQYPSSDETSEFELQTTFKNKLHLIYQKLIIKHGRLKKLSLWGCSGLDVSSCYLKSIMYGCIGYLFWFSLYELKCRLCT